MLMASSQIISSQADKLVMGIVQDTLCGIRKFTLRDSFLDWNQVQNILLWAACCENHGIFTGGF
jgi:hypothetical protein